MAGHQGCPRLQRRGGRGDRSAPAGLAHDAPAPPVGAGEGLGNTIAPGPAKRESTGAVALRTVGLGKRYGHVWGLRDCTLTVPAGAIVGLVGPNGAGKTTLLE